MAAPFVLVDAALAEVGTGAVVDLPADTDHHLRRVLRLAAGDPVVLGDGRGTTLAARLDDTATVATGDARRHPARVPTIRVLQALPKGRKLDDVVRALTELGVDRISPVEAERSLARLDGARADKALARWRSIARAAAEQSRNPWCPQVDAPVRPDGLDLAGERVLVAWVGATGLRAALDDELGGAPERVALAIGPEGDWTRQEVAALGGAAVGLGPTVLRTEHAAAALAAIVAHRLGRTEQPPPV